MDFSTFSNFLNAFIVPSLSRLYIGPGVLQTCAVKHSKIENSMYLQCDIFHVQERSCTLTALETTDHHQHLKMMCRKRSLLCELQFLTSTSSTWDIMHVSNFYPYLCHENLLIRIMHA